MSKAYAHDTYSVYHSFIPESSTISFFYSQVGKCILTIFRIKTKATAVSEILFLAVIFLRKACFLPLAGCPYPRIIIPPIRVARWWSLPLHLPVTRQHCFCGTLQLLVTLKLLLPSSGCPAPAYTGHRATSSTGKIVLPRRCACLDFPLPGYQAATTRCTLVIGCTT